MQQSSRIASSNYLAATSHLLFRYLRQSLLGLPQRVSGNRWTRQGRECSFRPYGILETALTARPACESMAAPSRPGYGRIAVATRERSVQHARWFPILLALVLYLGASGQASAHDVCHHPQHAVHRVQPATRPQTHVSSHSVHLSAARVYMCAARPALELSMVLAMAGSPGPTASRISSRGPPGL